MFKKKWRGTIVIVNDATSKKVTHGSLALASILIIGLVVFAWLQYQTIQSLKTADVAQEGSQRTRRGS